MNVINASAAFCCLNGYRRSSLAIYHKFTKHTVDATKKNQIKKFVRKQGKWG